MKNKHKSLYLAIVSIVITLSFAFIFVDTYMNRNLALYASTDDKVLNLVPHNSKHQNHRNKYYINITLDEDKKSLSGYEIFSFKNNYNCDLSELVFHLYADSYNSSKTMPSIGFRHRGDLSPKEIGDIVIHSVKINNKNLDFSQDNQILKIFLPKPIKKNNSSDIIIEFSLKIPKGTDRLGYMSNQYSITNWYPILSIYNFDALSWDENQFYPIGESNYSDCADYWIDLNTSSNIVSVSTGTKARETFKGNLKTTTFKAPNVRDFAFFMSSDYKVISATKGNIKINSYYLKDSTYNAAKRMLDLASEALLFFSEKFGDYPYEEFDIVETHLSGGAMEYPTIIQMGPYPNLSPEIDSTKFSFFDEAVVHEVAHQWWYSTVGNNSFKESILDESFTSFSTCYFFSNKYGEYNSRGIKGSLLCSDYYIEKSFFPIYRSVDEMNWYNWGIVVYKLGAIAIEDFHQLVGDDKFLETFQTYYEEFKFKNATFNDFLIIVERVCSKEASNYVRNSFTSNFYDYRPLLINEREKLRIK